MTPINTAALINLLGFTTGAVLYTMLLGMVIKRPAAKSSMRWKGLGFSGNGLLFATAILGILWNIGALATYGVKDFVAGEPFPFLVALSLTALGFLPAVVVHSALQTQDGTTKASSVQFIKFSAYALSIVAGVMHFYNGLATQAGLSNTALRVLTVGYIALIVALFLITRYQPGWKRAVWASALAVFAVSALHLSNHAEGGIEHWSIEFIGHHASLPLALAILYQDYRFAFADIFLKRALALLLLVALAFGLYIFVASPLLTINETNKQIDPRAVGALLVLWIVTALLYPTLRRTAIWFIDKIVLRRADYGELRASLARSIGTHESTEEVLEEVCQTFTPALTARQVKWWRIDETVTDKDSRLSSTFQTLREDNKALTGATGKSDSEKIAAQLSATAEDASLVTLTNRLLGVTAILSIPTAEPPFYCITIGELAGGRRLLSDDIEMLESVAAMAARRIDALRVAHERCEQGLREQEMSKLATEAQLRALRAQVNPHFLFNALTTIGYLIKTSPERALETLMKLTDLLRRVLRSTGEFVTLGEELKLIASYLDIERERFEERLRVSIDVPDELLNIRMPSLLVQPLVENAIKHGIAPARFGGKVTISARLERQRADAEMLCITVHDTGIGASEIELARGRRRGLGLTNIEERLKCYCGQQAALEILSASGEGTTVQLRMPISISPKSQPVASGR